MLTATEDSIVQLWNFEEICKNKNGTQMTQINMMNADKNKSPQITQINTDKNKNYSIPHNSSIAILRFSPDNKYFATADNNNQIHIFPIEDITRKSPTSNFKPLPAAQQAGQTSNFSFCSGHSDAIMDMNFSPDSKYIVSGSRDYTVRLWNLDGIELQMFTGHKGGINKCKFSHDGNFILSASLDFTARLMPVNVGMVLDKINKQKVRGEVYSLSEEEMKLFGVKK
ncbi:MAG: hypothetical protein HY840_01380 [Bacteroidetes bacterium]|nr:hypothetical protein [Bacteroidota bacterium]